MTRSDVTLFLLQELERIRLILQKLEETGVIKPELAALATLEAELHQRERQLSVEGPSTALLQALADLKRRIAVLEAALPPKEPRP